MTSLAENIRRDGRVDLLHGLETYADPDNRNRVIYYERSIPQNEPIQKIIDDAVSLLPRSYSAS